MKKSELPQTESQLLPALLGSTLLLSTPIVFSTSQVYWGNTAEFGTSYWATLPFLIGFLLIGVVSLTCLLLSLPQRWRPALMAMVFGLSAGMWVQSTFLVWNEVVLDGRPITLSEKPLMTTLEVAIWLGIVFIAFITRRTITVHYSLLTLSLLATQALAFAANAVIQPPRPSYHQYSLDSSEKYLFNRDRNVLMIVLDAFQADIMQEILDENPRYQSDLDGFRYFRDNTAGYSKTYPSFALMLTGQWYENDRPITKFLEEAFENHSITRQLIDQGWNVGLYPYVDRVLHFSRQIASNMNFDVPLNDRLETTARLLDVAAFRASPQLLKPFWLNDYNWRFSSSGTFLPAQPDTLKDEVASPHPVIRFLDEMENRMSVEAQDPAFRLYHLNVPHEPFMLTATLEMKRLPSGRSGFYEHSVAGIETVLRVLNHLKSAGIYDETLIFVVSDHGGGDYETGVRPDPILDSTRLTSIPTEVSNIPAHHHASALSLLLVKPFQSRGMLETTDAQTSLADLPATLAELLELKRESPGRSILSISATETRKRRYLYYEFREWEQSYLPDMTEYEVSGHSWLAANWTATGRTFIANQSTETSPGSAEGYSTGTVIFFNKASVFGQWLVQGWSGQESQGVWMTGAEAVLRIPLKTPISGPLEGRFLMRPYLAQGRFSHRKISVYVNDVPSTELTLERKTDALIKIPDAVLDAAPSELIFRFVTEPVGSPADHQDSFDARILGFYLYSLSIGQPDR